jgi:two-component system phosphate regulon sensor histidine kinase PhoR
MVARMLQRPALRNTDLSTLDRIAATFAWRDKVYIGVRDASGHVVATSAWDTPGATGVEPEVASAARGRPASSIRFDGPRGEPRVFAAAPIMQDGKVRGVVQVSLPRLWVDRALMPAWWALLTALVLGTIAALVLGTWRARALSWPVLELARAAKGIAGGDLSKQVSVRGEDEIAQLAATFNTMAAELRQKLAAVNEERARVGAIISSMTDAVVAVDAAGAILLVNRAAGDLLGLRSNARGQSLRGLLGTHPLCRVIEATAAQGSAVGEEVSLPDERLLEVHATPLRPRGDAAGGVVAVVRDVTELRHTERLRRELTANVSHELRTPLTSIKGFAETLLGGAMADEVLCRRFLTIIDDEASRLMKLVDDLMNLSRLESHAVAIEPAPVRLDRLAEEAVGRMRPQADRRHIALRATVLEPQTVMADRDRILQVVTNLLDNAIKFTPEGGAVEVTVRRRNGSAELEVTDSGRGIPDDALPRIFDRFYRVERSRSREEGGTGLGLAIAKHIVDAHGGRISADSQVGRGSVFTVRLPGADQAPSRP